MLILQGHTAPVQAVVFAADGRTLVSSDGGAVTVWDLDAGRFERSFKLRQPGGRLSTLALGGERLVYVGENQSVWVVHLATCKEYRLDFGIRASSISRGGSGRTAFDAGGLRLALVTEYHHPFVHVWRHISLLGHPVTEGWAHAWSQYPRSIGEHAFGDRPSVAFVPGRPELVVCTGGRNVLLLDQADGRVLRCCQHPERCKVRSAVCSPDGSLLATAAGQRVRLWNLADGTELPSLEGHGQYVTCLAFAPDGRRLLSGGRDRQVHLWDTSTGRRLAYYQWRIGVPRVLAFAPDGMTAVVAGDTPDLVLFDVDESLW